MIAQVLQDSKGNETGVFIPIEEWNRMKADYPGLEQEAEANHADGFILTEEQIKRLEDASAEPRENCISFGDFKMKVAEKYGI